MGRALHHPYKLYDLEPVSSSCHIFGKKKKSTKPFLCPVCLDYRVLGTETPGNAIPAPLKHMQSWHGHAGLTRAAER